VAADHGRKKDLTIVATLQELVEPETAGDPMTGQIWVRSSLRSLRDRLEAVGHPVSAPTGSTPAEGSGLCAARQRQEARSLVEPPRPRAAV